MMIAIACPHDDDGLDRYRLPQEEGKELNPEVKEFNQKEVRWRVTRR